ncbi:MAG: hydroxymethylglutaryl-CoA lyase [Dethiosulfatibacter sp.]|nr:hydroxymethylglutaryl-CoA lyase [Dethiosulfatibacter sp.]
MKLPKEIIICEVGPRDGFQNEKTPIKIEDKIKSIDMASEAGFRVIEIGSFVHLKAVPQMADTDEIARMIKKKPNVEYRALAANLLGIERAYKAGVKKVKLTVSASESHNISNFNRKPKESVKIFKECVDLAKKYDIEVSGAISTSFGCPFEGEISIERIDELVLEFVKLGIKEISLSDTTGVANPKEVYEKCLYFKTKYKDLKWILHLHNTRGMALANVLAGMGAGIIFFDSSFAGLGGCPYAPGASGNLATEDLVHMLQEMDIKTGINIDKAIETGKFIKKIVGHDTDSYVLKAGKVKDLVKEKPKKQNKINKG